MSVPVNTSEPTTRTPSIDIETCVVPSDAYKQLDDAKYQQVQTIGQGS